MSLISCKVPVCSMRYYVSPLSLCVRSLCLCAVRDVPLELVRPCRKESLSAATTVSHVQRERSATTQVIHTL